MQEEPKKKPRKRDRSTKFVDIHPVLNSARSDDKVTEALSCPKCHGRVRRGEKLCDHCGTKLRLTEDVASAPRGPARFRAVHHYGRYQRLSALARGHERLALRHMGTHAELHHQGKADHLYNQAHKHYEQMNAAHGEMGGSEPRGVDEGRHDFKIFKSGDKHTVHRRPDDGRADFYHEKTFDTEKEARDHVKAENGHLMERLSPSMGPAAYVHDFAHSKSPEFEGKPTKKRIKMGLAAYFRAKRASEDEDRRRESVD